MRPSGQIAHVYLHTRLALRASTFKTHWLRWENSLIRRAAPRKGLNLPSLDPVSEAVLLVVRACLELRRSDSGFVQLVCLLVLLTAHRP